MSQEFPFTFKFKGFLVTFLCMLSVIILFIFILTLGALQGGGAGALVFGVAMVTSLIFISYIFLVGKASIIISDSAIKRVFLGRQLQSLAWTEIERIVVFPMRSPGMSRSMTAYNIIPCKSARIKRFPKKIYFGDQYTDLTELITAMNFFIKLHGIKVENKFGGRTEVKSSL
ncbi:hypothetical protein [Xanthomonas oryzae]|uniref:hypothetical protein n=1 Tax=Xanthomonas oryzae TaxID=347 RepID=UPI001033C186|nr:hypothetical protein [Xanthomonas oryzae]QBH01487.1 hypothetical protein EYC56_22295 [Xanthomonas oryzae]QBH05369.1 hypothetical protein EYC57_21180 [Xanthomonas oryzae]